MGPTITSPESAAGFSVPGAEFFVDLAGHIDVAAEIARTEKEREKLAGWIASTEKKLANENFVSRAKPDVVQGERDKLARLQQDLAGLETALTKLRAM